MREYPLVMLTHDGTELRVDLEMHLTINGEEPKPQEVIDFLITFAEDSNKGPVATTAITIDLVKEAACLEECKAGCTCKEEEK